MPNATVGGLNIVYEIVGSSGPVVAVMPGARRGYLEMRPLAEKIAGHGFRVFLHDRRNTGASDLKLDDSETEESIWADELHDLLGQLGLRPAYICGSSSGARTSMMYALRHPGDLKGLILIRVTGGKFAAERLPINYYQAFIDAAKAGGMEAIVKTDRFIEYLSHNPAARDQLLAMDPEKFIEVQTNLLAKFRAGADLPVMGTTEAQLNSIKVPTLVIPGNDNTHSSVSGRIAHEMIKGSEIHSLPIEDQDVDLITWTDWGDHEAEIAATMADFMRRAEQRAA